MHRNRSVLGTLYGGAAAVLIMAGTSMVALASQGHDEEREEEMEGGHPGASSEVTRTIRIEAKDIAFDKKNIKVKAGETVRFVIVNTGELVHDFTLGTPDLQEEHGREMVEEMGGEGMDTMEHEEPNAVMVDLGETKELIWTFSKAADFKFQCNVPGHAEAGMKGSIEITD